MQPPSPSPGSAAAPPASTRPRTRTRRILTGAAVVVSLGALGAGLAGIFVDLLHLPAGVLDVLDKRSSVFSAITGLLSLLISARSLALQLRPSAPAQPVDDGAPARVYGGDHVEFGGDNPGVIVTGEGADAVLPPVVQVPAGGLTGLPRRAAAVFVGREEQLRQLAGALGRGPGVIAQAVVGLGGIGKSELALHHATIRRHDYDLIWWIDAETPEAARAGLAGLCRALCAGTASAAAARAPVAEAEAWALAWLGAHARWLLVFDNADDPAQVQPYLGRLHTGHVLITSRRSTGWDDAGAVVRLGVLEHAQAVALLRELIGESTVWNQDLAAELAAELDGLPLALRHAGAYIAATPGVDLARYLRLLRTTPGAGQPGLLEEVVARSLAVTTGRIAQISPPAIEVLRLLACYAPDHLPCRVLYGMDADEVEVAEALRVLASYSVIDRSAGDAVSAHRLVQAATLATLTETERENLRRQAAALLQAALPDDPKPLENRPVYAGLLAHAVTVLDPGSDAMGKVVAYLDAAGDWRTARTLQRRRLTALSDRLGPEHPDTLRAQHSLARWTGEAGEVEAARQMLAQLLPVAERVLGAEHPSTLSTRHSLASWTGNAGEVEAARQMFAQLLPVAERVLGAEHPTTLSTRHSLAHWTGNAGDAREVEAARQMLAQLLPVAERVLGAEHPDTLIARHNLARWTGNAGDAEAARQMFAQLLLVAERVLGAEHPTTLSTRHSLARWTGNAGDAEAARQMLAQLLPVRERVLGVEHPSTLSTRHSLAYWTGQAGGLRPREWCMSFPS